MRVTSLANYDVDSIPPALLRFRLAATPYLSDLCPAYSLRIIGRGATCYSTVLQERTVVSPATCTSHVKGIAKRSNKEDGAGRNRRELCQVNDDTGDSVH